MASEILQRHRVNVDEEMKGNQKTQNARTSEPLTRTISGVSVHGTVAGSLWSVVVNEDAVKSITNTSLSNHAPPKTPEHRGLLAPSLCHPHIHLDKAYLLSHPKYSHRQVEQGDFVEAMRLTEQAKAEFEMSDLLERGQRVIDESIAAGVTHMRAFVEVDAGVNTKCLEAGLTLKQRAALNNTCTIQVCAFAQLPIFSRTPNDEDGSAIRQLMREAAGNSKVDVVGSTPYVETSKERMEKNVEWMVSLSIEFDKHLDFHLDYNVDLRTEPLVWHVLRTLKGSRWKERTNGRTVVLGHCTRLALFDDQQWRQLASEIKEMNLPVHFVGLPTSDLFMMRTSGNPEVRGTLNVPKLIQVYGLNACISINNVGNAFTPYGSCDPLSLACQCVGVYQAGTKRDAELLYECISTRAKTAIGFQSSAQRGNALNVTAGDSLGLVLYRNPTSGSNWARRDSVSELVYLHDGRSDREIFRGSS